MIFKTIYIVKQILFLYTFNNDLSLLCVKLVSDPLSVEFWLSLGVYTHYTLAGKTGVFDQLKVLERRKID